MSSKTSTFAKSDSAGYQANHMARLFALALQARIKPLGLSTGQFPVLLELWEADGLTQRELVERVDIEQATMANTLSRMQRDGLIERRPHPTDRRAQLVWLTEKAKALREAATDAAEATNRIALADLSSAERDQLAALMRRVISALRRSEGS